MGLSVFILRRNERNKSFKLNNCHTEFILILKLVEDLGVNILFSSLVMINYVQ